MRGRDTNDYLPINANIISITKDKEDAELKEGEQSSQEKYDALMAAIKEGMTDDEFSTAVTALGYSASSNTLTRTYSNEEIRNYLFDESRKAGDLTTIETDTTYYIVRYVSAAEETYRDSLVKNSMWNDLYNGIVGQNKAEIDEEVLKNANTDLTFGTADTSSEG